MKDMIGKTLGGALIVAGTAAVWMWPDPVIEVTEDETVRPIRSAVVEAGYKSPDLYFPARIDAGEERSMSFKHPGRIASIPVSSGDRVMKGGVLATLEKESFVEAVEIAKAALERDRLAYERRLNAAAKNAVSGEELTAAEAQYNQSRSRLRDAERDLEETVLVAPFDGVVSRKRMDELRNVAAGDEIILFHDITKISVKVVIPETMVIGLKNMTFNEDDPEMLTISFDSAPGLSFPVKFKDFESSANENTQTFTVSYSLPAPKELLLLPGMSGTLKLSGRHYAFNSESTGKEVTVPESAVGAASDGSAFAWVLAPTTEAGVWTVHKRSIKVGRRAAGLVRVDDGLSAGERIATAGVAVLTEGRKVRVLED